MTEQDIIDVGGITYIIKSSVEERKRRVVEVATVISLAQRARLATRLELSKAMRAD